MEKTVVILGGYGVFGQKIARALSKDNVDLIIAGRDASKAAGFAVSIKARPFTIDVSKDLKPLFEECRPFIVVNCCGPFQQRDYSIAQACIDHGVHYIDLADARNYIVQFSSLDAQAKNKSISAITGASTVPAISAAILDYFQKEEFSEIHAVDYGVTPGNRTERGIATIAAILSYTGKSFKTLVRGKETDIYGWQDLHREDYPEIGKRWMSNCDVSDLALFPNRYPTLKTIRFYAGLELSVLHIGLWLLSWLVRWHVLDKLADHAGFLRQISLWFYNFGSDSGGMHIRMTGLNNQGLSHQKSCYIIAHDGDGPQIPAIPAIILVKKILSGQITPGAFSAVGLITRDDIMREIRPYQIKEVVQ